MLKESFILTCVIIVALSSPGQASDVDFLDGKTYELRTRRWPDWFVVIGTGNYGDLNGSDKEVVEPAGMFIFEQVSDDEPYFFIKSMTTPRRYVYMTHTATGFITSAKCEPGLEGQWLITKEGDYYTFSPEQWPTWFMCMKNDDIGTMEGCKNNNAYRAMFTLTEVVTDQEPAV